jgi:hypothetical protein
MSTFTKTWTIPDSRPEQPGPWDSEPDKAQWIDQGTGLDCLIVRNRLGTLCGYVGIPAGHPWHGWDYDEVPAHVHGGLTYADRCQEDQEHGICHVPEPGRPDDVWWLGFDCGHLGDLVPGMESVRRAAGLTRMSRDEVYRDVAYVRSECERLAAQAAAAGRPA